MKTLRTFVYTSMIRTAGGQQIIVMTTAGGMKTVQHVTTSQAGAGT